MLFFMIFLAVASLAIVKTEYYTKKNATSTFQFFKEKYHKTYSKAEEREAYKNFVNNLNKVTTLNMDPNLKDAIYVLNKYADLNPLEVEEHFAVNISAYDKEDLYKGPIVRNPDALRSIIEPIPENPDLESMELYDLDDAENLYKQYVKAFKKNNTKKYDRTVHFYKFVKSLVQLNRDHYKGKKGKDIDDKADVIEHPTDYYY